MGDQGESPNTMPDRIRALAELGRISNAATCISNVLVGAAIASVGRDLEPAPIALVSCAIVLLYVGGMALNDVVDVEWDKDHGAHRPIASGRLSRGTAITMVIVCMALAIGMLALTHWQAIAAGLVLVTLIVLYDLLHKKRPWTVLFMGLCRGFVYVTAALTIARGSDVNVITLTTLAIAITLYTIAITIVARTEHTDQVGMRKWVSLFIPAIVLAAAVVVNDWHWSTVVAGAVVTLWLLSAAARVLASPPRTRSAVLKWIAGMSLVDAWFLCLLGQPIAALIAGVCFVVTAWGHRKIPGT